MGFKRAAIQKVMAPWYPRNVFDKSDATQLLTGMQKGLLLPEDPFIFRPLVELPPAIRPAGPTSIEARLLGAMRVAEVKAEAGAKWNDELQWSADFMGRAAWTFRDLLDGRNLPGGPLMGAKAINFNPYVAAAAYTAVGCMSGLFNPVDKVVNGCGVQWDLAASLNSNGLVVREHGS